MNSDQQYQRFEQLWTDFLEGDLTDEPELSELRQLLEADESLVVLAADLYQTHRLLGLAATSSSSETTAEAFVQDTMAHLPKTSEGFAGEVMTKITSPATLSKKNPANVAGLLFRYGGWAAAALLMLGLFLRSPEKQNGSPGISKNQVRFENLAKARFFGELTPPAGTSPLVGQDYTLTEGLVELAFPSGATTIIEAPALFRVTSEDSLALDVGRCSVHAPPGAEGFRVDTPVMQVVDRGTRFFVNVAESSDTEVQVVEGAADLYPRDSAAKEIRLVSGGTHRSGSQGPMPSSYSPSVYRASLPDRIVSYEATRDDQGGVEALTEVVVQRGGKPIRYGADELIGVDLIAFRSAKTNFPLVDFMAPGELPEKRANLSSDLLLTTGVINPGGSRTALTGPFPIEETPGFAVRFHQPVVNGPGPDVVFFEIQMKLNPPQGDAFHVSPLSWTPQRKSHTIQTYDLTLSMAEALTVAGFYSYSAKTQTPQSLEQLESVEVVRNYYGKFQAIAVGIDLSDLGIGDGESIDGLFFQDALDDKHYVDPVFIGGLPR